MNKTELVIMAAGLSSRYRGMKQLDGMDEYGQPILAYSVYDAYLSGFDGVTMVVAEGATDTFRSAIGDKIASRLPVTYVEQKLSDVPSFAKIPDGRTRPWGTGHAVLSCRKSVKTPFAVINSDDFYGRDAFVKMHDFLSTADATRPDWAMIKYLLKDTVTGEQPVSRAACKTKDDLLTDLVEMKVRKIGNGYEYLNDSEYCPIDGNTIVSMNMWGFTPSLFNTLNADFERFFATNDDLSTSEFGLGDSVFAAAKTEAATVRVLPATSQWFGVTYHSDKSYVLDKFAALRAQGVYPDVLF